MLSNAHAYLELGIIRRNKISCYCLNGKLLVIMEKKSGAAGKIYHSNKVKTYRVVVGIVTGVLSVDALEYFQRVIIISALHHELGALGEGEEPKA